jgi:hypothetical protein
MLLCIVFVIVFCQAVHGFGLNGNYASWKPSSSLLNSANGNGDVSVWYQDSFIDGGSFRRSNRRPIIAGNWKLNPSTLQEAKVMLKLIASYFKNHEQNEDVDIVVFPPFPYITTAVQELEGTGIKVGAQNVGIHEKGAFTG